MKHHKDFLLKIEQVIMESEEDSFLFHTTSSKNIPLIQSQGIKPVSYWGIESIVSYYAETIEDDGDNAVIIKVPISKFDPSLFEPDLPGIDEPITTVLGKSERAIHNAWDKSKKTWKSSLKIIGSVRYKGIIHPDMNDIKSTSPIDRLSPQEKMDWERFIKFGVELPTYMRWLAKFKPSSP